MNKINKTQKITILTTLFFVVVLVFYVFLYKQILSLNSKIISINSKLVVANRLAENEKEIVNLLKNTETKREKLSSYFVSTENPTSFLETIESSARSVGTEVEVQSLDVKHKDKEKKQSFIKVSLLAKGSWDSMFRFMLLLENLPYVVVVSNSAFTMGGDGDDFGKWEGQITLLCGEI